MNGFLNLLKPPGVTSNGALNAVKRALPRKTPVGHGGTLDPDAAGVLPISVGKATRLFDYMIDKTKIYIAELTLGTATDTQDASGAVVETSDRIVPEDELRAVLPRFVGDILQTPPMYSAISVGGRRMYELARKGESVELAPRPARIESLELTEKLAENRYLLKIACGRGVYIRTLLFDIGRALSCPAHMSFLLRARSGIFSVEDAVTLEEIAPDTLSARLAPPDAPLSHLPLARCGERSRRYVLNGNAIPSSRLTEAEAAEGIVRVYVEDDFAGVGEWSGDEIRFRAMLLEA